MCFAISFPALVGLEIRMGGHLDILRARYCANQFQPQARSERLEVLRSDEHHFVAALFQLKRDSRMRVDIAIAALSDNQKSHAKPRS